MAFTLPDLPYAKDAFGDLLSVESFDYHHGKHHKAYVDKANELLGAKDKQPGTLVEAIEAAKGKDKPLLYNTAQIWNHSFFWQCLSPDTAKPDAALARAIDDAFGSHDKLVTAMIEEGKAHFGSGWAWLVRDGGELKVTSFHDADTPLVHGVDPLLTIDVWEHAYYIDYRNARPDYLKALVNDAIDWNFVSANMDGKGAERADQTW